MEYKSISKIKILPIISKYRNSGEYMCSMEQLFWKSDETRNVYQLTTFWKIRSLCLAYKQHVWELVAGDKVVAHNAQISRAIKLIKTETTGGICEYKRGWKDSGERVVNRFAGKEGKQRDKFSEKELQIRPLINNSTSNSPGLSMNFQTVYLHTVYTHVRVYLHLSTYVYTRVALLLPRRTFWRKRKLETRTWKGSRWMWNRPKDESGRRPGRVRETYSRLVNG